jgi:hypothetical protein
MVLTGCIYEPVPRLVQCSLFIFGFPSYASLHNDLSRPNTTLASMQDLIILDNAVHQPMHAQNWNICLPHTSSRNMRPELEYGGD